MVSVPSEGITITPFFFIVNVTGSTPSAERMTVAFFSFSSRFSISSTVTVEASSFTEIELMMLSGSEPSSAVTFPVRFLAMYSNVTLSAAASTVLELSDTIRVGSVDSTQGMK